MALDRHAPYLVIEKLFDRHGNIVGEWSPLFFGKKRERPTELRPPHLYTFDELEQLRATDPRAVNREAVQTIKEKGSS